MPIINVASQLDYAVQSPTSFVFSVAAAATDHQRIRHEQLNIDPPVEFEWCQIGESSNRSIRLRADPGDLKLTYSARVELTPEVDQPPSIDQLSHHGLPPEVLPYLNPSRYCESDRLGAFAYKTFAESPPGYARVEAICDWVNGNVDYVSGSTNASSSACDVLLERAGVCRDFAHVGIALCRAMGIPARYVAGYAARLEPPDFHGFFEVFLEGKWYLFDATRMAPVGGFVRIGQGRDAADASFATIVGIAQLQTMEVSALEDANGSEVQGDDVAISTA